MARKRQGRVRPGESAGRGYTLVYVEYRGRSGEPGRLGRVMSTYIRIPVAARTLGNLLRLAVAALRSMLDRIGRSGGDSGGSVSDWDIVPSLSVGI